MPTLSQYKILNRLRSKIAIARALGQQTENGPINGQELQEQEQVNALPDSNLNQGGEAYEAEATIAMDETDVSDADKVAETLGQDERSTSDQAETPNAANSDVETKQETSSISQKEHESVLITETIELQVSPQNVAHIASGTAKSRVDTPRADTPRADIPRIRSAKLTGFFEKCKMSAVPEVETNDTSVISSAIESKPEEHIHISNRPNMIEVVPLFEDKNSTDSYSGPEADTSSIAENDLLSDITEHDDKKIIKSPVRPCLKRSDSCFVRRPESRSKSVTFESHFKLYADRGRRSLDSSQTDISLSYNQDNSDTEKDFSESEDNVFGSDDSGEHKKKAQRLKRPSSCGPSFQRTSQVFSALQRLESDSRKHQKHDRRPSSDNLPLLPKFSVGGYFSVRRGSLINRTLFSNNEHPSKWFTAAAMITSERKDFIMQPFETYIIRNCRLIRRDRLGSLPGHYPESPKDATKGLDATDDKIDNEVNGADSTEREIKDLDASSSAIKTGQFEATEFRDQETPGLKLNNNEIHRWSNEKQAIVVERPTSAMDMAGSAYLLQKSAIWKDDVLKIPDDQKEELLKLGFRKPPKTKKKKKVEKRKKQIEHVAPQRIEINLKEDPLLIKVSKKNKNVGHFTEKPEAQPNAVCFEITGSRHSHQEVKEQLQKLLKTCPEVKIVSIKFDHRSLYHNSKDMYNRWIITTNSMLGRNRLAGSEILLGGEVYQLRRYDDVINGEFQQFTRMQNFVNMMNNRKILGKHAGDKK